MTAVDVEDVVVTLNRVLDARTEQLGAVVANLRTGLKSRREPQR